MKSLLICLAFFEITGILAAPLASVFPTVPVGQPSIYKTDNFQTVGLSKAEIRDDAGQYSLSYVTGNGIRVTERSFLKLGPHGDYIPVREGTYYYVSPEGIPVSYGYIADENGFVIKGSPLPVAPGPIA